MRRRHPVLALSRKNCQFVRRLAVVAAAIVVRSDPRGSSLVPPATVSHVVIVLSVDMCISTCAIL